MTLNETAKDHNEKEFPAIGFRVGEEEYGLRLTAIQEIVTTPRITRVPKAPAYIKGVINHHGNVIPVIDIAARFGVGETTVTAASRVVVIETENEAVGFLADAVSKVTRFSSADIQPPPPLVSGIAAEFLEGIVRTSGRFLIFLELERTLSEDTIKREDNANPES